MLNSEFLTKLKFKLQISINPPKIVQKNFLNKDELNLIKTKVFLLKNHWKYLQPENNLNLTTRMLPAGMYSATIHHYKEIVLQYKNLMYLQFSYFYTKIQSTLNNYLNCDFLYHSDTNYPGFHIYVLPDGVNYGEYNWYNFHTDGFNFLYKFFNYEKIYSCVIPIDLPKRNAALIYTLNNTSPKDFLDKNIIYDRIQYYPGDLLIWDSKLIHSIEPFVLTDDECRLTMQFHVAIRNNTGIIFW